MLLESEFQSLPPGTSRTWLDSAPDLRLPVLSVTGPTSGPCLVVTAGVHGDEYEGCRAIYEIVDELDPASLRGSLLAVPVVNEAAHRAVSRTHPQDGKNLARVFPGAPGGSISERLAWLLGHEIIARANFYLDLHSGGVNFAMPSMVGFDLNDPRGRAAAEAFGAPVTWGHPLIEAGRTISFARDRDIPFLYTEAKGAGRIDPLDLAMMKRGIRNLLIHLGILEGSLEIPTPPRRLYGIGNTDEGVSADFDGFWMPSVRLLDRVERGQRLGVIVDPLGNVLEEKLAPLSGVVGLLRELPPVHASDVLLLLAQEKEA